MKKFTKALGIVVLLSLLAPALLGAVGALLGFIIAAWPMVIGFVVVAIPGVIVGILVSKEEDKKEKDEGGK